MRNDKIGSMAVALAAMAVALVAGPRHGEATLRYPWRAEAATKMTLAERVPPPAGFDRLPAGPGSFAEWLRGLPVTAEGTPVRLYDGRPKWNQGLHVAVIDIDTGARNLQQCADAIMRLRAEYFLGSGRAREIGFNATDGKRMSFKGSAEDYRGFRRYMDRVFVYAGSYSLEREMRTVPPADMQIGDVFIKGGFPGHAVLVVDMAVDASRGEKRFLLMQSFMPAQDMHVLKNPRSQDGTPWYAIPAAGQQLITPEWIFAAEQLRRFKNEPLHGQSFLSR